VARGLKHRLTISTTKEEEKLIGVSSGSVGKKKAT